jgi:prepilin-type N-terminal cleavage/methylation domain-containing protein
MVSSNKTAKILHPRGYSLVEMAIVISLIGLLVGSALTVGGSKVERKNIAAIDTQLDDVETALYAFYKKYDRLPCPASPTLTEADANFGVEDNCTSANPTLADIVQLNDTTADEQWVGTLPTRSLGLPNNKMYDVWGSRLVYAIDKDFADATKTFNSEEGTLAATMLKINDKNNNSVYIADTKNPVVYILLSHGKDKRGAYNKSGTISVSCDSINVQSDVENCDFTTPSSRDSIFLDSELADSAIDEQYYYDKIRWKTKNRINLYHKDQIAYSPFVTSNSLGTAGRLCILNHNKMLECAGSDTNEALGNGSLQGNSAVFAPEANGFSDWESVSGSLNGGCGLRANQQAYCWGSNTFKESGYEVASTLPKLVSGGINNWTKIQRGTNIACGLSEGKLYCWGNNSGLIEGSMPTSYTNTAVPKQIKNDTGTGYWNDWEDFTIGSMTACGLRVGNIYCWGFSHGVFATSGTDVRLPRKLVGGPPTWKILGAIGSGAYGACGIATDNKLYCWGDNRQGQIGDGTHAFPAFPWGKSVTLVSYTGADDWNQLSSSYFRNCGLRGTGEIWCWGSNNGTVIQKDVSSGFSYLTPTKVNMAGFSDFKFIKDEGQFLCGVRANGDVYCKGNIPPPINGYRGGAILMPVTAYVP